MSLSHPILYLSQTNKERPFAAYLSEILAVEGVQTYDSHDLAKNPQLPENLKAYALILIGRCQLDTAQIETLFQYVQNGGSLITSRPPVPLAEKFGVKGFVGLNDTVDRIRESYLLKTPELDNLLPFPYPSLQFHGEAEMYQNEDAEVLANFGIVRTTSSTFPAIFKKTSGQGTFYAFAYDLAETILLLHQGDARCASDGPFPDTDLDQGYKSNDFFYEYLDPELKELPQADLQQDILVAMIQEALAEKIPLPRVWHFPHAAPAIAMINGDSDEMTPGELDSVIDAIEEHGGKFTTFLLQSDYQALPPEKWADLRLRGHDIGPHPFCGRLPSVDQVRANMAKDLAAFRQEYDYQPVAQRGHHVVWVGWVDQAKILAENGLKLDTNYIPGRRFQYGYVNGSALPVQFMDETGEMIPLYEQSTISTDDGMFSPKLFNPLKSDDEIIAISKKQIDRSIEEFHGVYHPYFHPICVRTLGTLPWIKAIAAYLKERNVPHVNGREWVEFNDSRRALQWQTLSWDAATSTLDITLSCPNAISGLTLLFPASIQQKKVDPSTNASLSLTTLENRQYLAWTLDLEASQPASIQLTYR
ncbi:MAG: hypothetical protein JKY51_00940 [Opitutaceae bacterium]|nr:hypothetical protein [Opitutaceae bacterium]